MKRRDNIKRMKKMMDDLRKGKKSSKKKKTTKKNTKKMDADVNNDGKVDEKDVKIVKEAAKKKESLFDKITKKKD